MIRLPIVAAALALSACVAPGPEYRMVPPNPQTAAREQFECEATTRSATPSFYYDSAWGPVLSRSAMADFYNRCLASRGWRQEIVQRQQ